MGCVKYVISMPSMPSSARTINVAYSFAVYVRQICWKKSRIDALFVGPIRLNLNRVPIRIKLTNQRKIVSCAMKSMYCNKSKSIIKKNVSIS